MGMIEHAFSTYAVPTAIIVAMIWGAFRPPRWFTKHVERRTKAWESSQASIAKSVNSMRESYSQTQGAIVRIEYFLDAATKLREDDNAKLETIVASCNEALSECRRIADACERMVAVVEPRRNVWTDPERAERTSDGD